MSTLGQFTRAPWRWLLLTLALGGCDVASRSESEDGSDCPGFCAYTPKRAVPPSESPVALHGRLAVNGAALVDAAGEPVQLRGVSSMWLNYETDGYAESRAGLEWLRDHWHISLIRASMGVEPSGGYLQNPLRAKLQVQRIVRHAIDLGLYVIVDFHAHHAEDQRAESEAFFTELAQSYGEYPNLIYEPFNEPLKVSWSSVLKPYHEAIVGAIRAVDPDNVVVLGTPQWSQLVDEASLDPLSGENLMYTVHFYACDHGQTLRDVAESAVSAGLPLFATEWGATEADGGLQNPRICEDEAQLWHDLLNRNQISWAAWKLDGCGDASCLLKPGTPVTGPFNDERMNGHAFFVRSQLLK